jgi:3'-phosphoadenosine 5'-phosphosulfate sulfotransferase (PAPS reductase)/FAD synthetase
MNARTEPALLARLSNQHLDALEEETIFILREVAAAFERPALLFSGGKDSLVLLQCAEKAFGAGRIPYPLLMIDTGHNFSEVTDFRDQRAAELQARLIVRNVEDSMARGTVRLSHPGESRNVHQSVTLLEAIEEFGFDALIGGARPRTSGPSCGRCSTPGSSRANTSAYSRSRTGPNSTYGNTSSASTSPCPRCITATSARWSSAKAC